MSKPKQKQKVKAKKHVPADRPLPPTPPKKHKPGFELIRFDWKTWTYISVCVFLFFLFVALKWHTSSVAYWNYVAQDGGNPGRGLVEGQPRGIRSDDWLVTSSFILSQYANGFPVTNEALGYGKTPLTFGLPTKHLLGKIRPAFWGYFFLDIERAYSWHWNFKIFPFLIVTFLLLMLFSKNNFLLSLFGSIWLLLSSAIQSWAFNTEFFTWGCLAVISLIYVLYTDNLRVLAVSGVLLTISSYSFIMLLYPAYQVPLVYFLFALIIGFFLKNKNSIPLITTRKLKWKIVTLGLSLVVLISLIIIFYLLSKDTIEVISNTVYPGKRNEGGGDFLFLKMFTDNFSLFMTDAKFPSGWVNFCELSAYLMLSPIASLIIIADYIKTRKANPLLIALIVYQFVIFFWLFIGLPEFLAKLSLFNTSPAYRTFYIFGFTNVIATILFLAHHKSSVIKNNLPSKLITLPILLLISYSLNHLLNKQSGFFFTTNQVIAATAIFGGLNWLVIHATGNKIFRIAFVISCFLIILPNIKINPLAKGLSPYYENNIFKTVSSINANDPGAGWAVFGNYTIPNFLKASGINCFNGVQFAPPLEKLHILDRKMKHDSIYNQYAHIAFTSYINGQDSIQFARLQFDVYAIRMDPCSPRFAELGIKYFMFTYEPAPVEVQYMTPVTNTSGYFIYKRNEI